MVKIHRGIALRIEVLNMNFLVTALSPLAVATAPNVDLNTNYFEGEVVEFNVKLEFIAGDTRDFFLHLTQQQQGDVIASN